MAEPRVLVLVLNYNAGAVLEPCLRSLQATTYRNARIVVLDNGSGDESMRAARDVGVEAREFGENLGYCAAYNRAFEMFRGEADCYLLSNPDLIVPPPTIGRMVASAGDDERIGFVGPVQRHADTRDVRSAGILWRCGRLPAHVRSPGGPVDAVEGAFLLVRRRVVDEVGGLDERFGLNLEDLEWQMRAARAGFRSVVATEAEVLHHRPGARRVTTGAYYQARNVCILTAKYCDAAALRLVRLRLFSEGLAAVLVGRPRGRFILEGLRDFRRGVTGMKRFNRGPRPSGPAS